MGRPQRIQELFGLDGRVASITGAGHGIGAETARLLADAGATVAIIDRNPDRAARLVAEIKGVGGQAHALSRTSPGKPPSRPSLRTFAERSGASTSR